MEGMSLNTNKTDVLNISTSTDYQFHASSIVMKDKVRKLEKGKNKRTKKTLPTILDYENQRLRVPTITFWFSLKDKKKLPFEARLLNSLGRLPRQMTGAPFILGEGNLLERIDEDPLEEPYDEENEIDNMNFDERPTAKSLQMDLKPRSTTEAVLQQPQLFRMKTPSKKSKMMPSIPEGTRLNEQNTPLTLSESQRRIIHTDKNRLEGIPEVRRFQELDEEDSEDEEPSSQEKLWM